MYQQQINHPANLSAEPLPPEVYEAMFDLFEHICHFWDNLDNPQNFKSRLFVFMDDRIRLHPEYRSFYIQANQTLDELVERLGEAAAYKMLFTDTAANQAPPQTPLSLVRQKVSNEFIAFQVSQGGFKAFTGAINYPGYIAGAFIPGEPVPYRTGQEGAQ
ncbi:hypothetical protein [Pseudomonas marginalis]|uniref:hypothetical protein n=1 Tax=Pseudomonas marginalis TaxID=298 RepID=UPI002A36BCE1|nr:hypothetical protein [Pseudomonas marginalis]WPN20917.1 hypothetical protein QMK57_15955 [Pseudomonas marginalis]